MKIEEMLEKITNNKKKIADIKRWVQLNQPNNEFLIFNLRSVEGLLAYLEKTFKEIKNSG